VLPPEIKETREVLNIGEIEEGWKEKM